MRSWKLAVVSLGAASAILGILGLNGGVSQAQTPAPAAPKAVPAAPRIISAEGITAVAPPGADVTARSRGARIVSADGVTVLAPPGFPTGANPPFAYLGDGANGWPASDDPRVVAKSKLNESRRQLKEAKTAEEKAKAKTAAREALVEYFDQDVQDRRMRLENLKKRTDEMTALLAKRSSSKDQLVELQLKSFHFDAEDLGLSGAGANKPPFTELPIVAYPVIPSAAPGTTSAYGTGGGISPVASRERLMEKLGSLKKAKSENDAEGIAKANTELREALGAYFNEDLEARRKELGEIKKNLDKMTDALGKRSARKDEIIDLHLQMIENESEGLGFFSDDMFSGFNPPHPWTMPRFPNVPAASGGIYVAPEPVPVAAPAP